ncbi:MAG: hypothetical protein JSW11_21380 [Candidatus Heimdallarchaeota archaeon]|nr:MAG: hypothetical protein JSW11_21380 [Candidatus Heimdallarchaeota archaeon]
MSRIPFFLFPEYKNQISSCALQKSLDLVESIVGFSKGNSLSCEAINRISQKLGVQMKGTTLYPGGSSCLFGWSFPFDKIGSIIIKPYYSRELLALIIHYLTWQDYVYEFQNMQFQLNDKEIQVKLPNVVGLAKIETFSRFFPVLMTTEAAGEAIQAYPSLIRKVGTFTRDLAKKGIISDPYPSNWKISFSNNHGIIQYIDLLSSNRLENVQKRVSELLKGFD